MAHYDRLCTHRKSSEIEMHFHFHFTILLRANHFHPALSIHPFPSPLIFHSSHWCRALSRSAAGDDHSSSLRVKDGVKPRTGCQLGLACPAFTQLTLKWIFCQRVISGDGNRTLSPVTSTEPPCHHNLLFKSY